MCGLGGLCTLLDIAVRISLSNTRTNKLSLHSGFHGLLDSLVSLYALGLRWKLVYLKNTMVRM